MRAFRLSGVGCLVALLGLGLLGCSKIKKAVGDKAEAIHIRQKTDNVNKALTGAWEVVKSDSSGLARGSSA